MIGDEVRSQISEVRRAIELIDVEGPQGATSSEGVRDLGQAVDNLRQSIWAVLTDAQVGDLNEYIGKVRVARATQRCGDVLVELAAAAIAPNASGLDALKGTLRQLVGALQTDVDE